MELCLLDPSRFVVHHSVSSSYGTGLGDPWGLLEMSLVLGFGVVRQRHRVLQCVLAAGEGSYEILSLFTCCTLSYKIIKQTCA